MNVLSRREEEQLMKTTKARAFKECDPLVKEFVECTQGRTLSLMWSCKPELRKVEKCIYQFTNPESMDLVRAEYIRLRDTNKPSGKPS